MPPPVAARREVQRSTITDVARRAQVSVTTVSHVLNGTRFVAPDTRARVLTAVEHLHYRPDAAARGLRSRRRQVIGLLITNPHNRAFASIMDGLDEVLTPAGYSIIVSATRGDIERERYCLRNLDEQRVDGVVIGSSAGGTRDLLCRLRDHGVPLVYINGVSAQFPDLPSDTVTLDFTNAAQLLAKHLVDLGHRRIAILGGLVGPREMDALHDGPFVAAWQRALMDAGDGVVASPVYPGVSREEVGYRLAREAMAQRYQPSALVTLNTPLAVGALLACRDLGLRVPHDVSVALLDDVPSNAITDPPLTAIPNAWPEFGTVAGQFLLDRIRGYTGAPRVHVFRARLVTRRSTADAKHRRDVSWTA
jgi:LacI family transcriptional regulator